MRSETHSDFCEFCTSLPYSLEYLITNYAMITVVFHYNDVFQYLLITIIASTCLLKVCLNLKITFRN